MEYIDIALSRAQSWFQIHADQRIKLINFFIILLAGTLALIGSALKDENSILLILAGISIE